MEALVKDEVGKGVAGVQVSLCVVFQSLQSDREQLEFVHSSSTF